MCNKINFDECDVILELGPGTGVFTHELLKRAKADTKIILLELNEEFYKLLQSTFNDPRIEILLRSADEIQEVLDERNIPQVDAILSSLPLTVIPKEIKTKIVSSSFNALKENGTYVQYQYSLNAKKLLKSFFGKLDIGFVPVNVPPAFVYTAKKKS